jgi:hypothetical protein
VAAAATAMVAMTSAGVMKQGAGAAMVYLLCLVPYPLNLSGAPKISGNQNKQLKRKSKQKNRQVKRVSQYERTLRYENKHFESIKTLVNTVWQLRR